MTSYRFVIIDLDAHPEIYTKVCEILQVDRIPGKNSGFQISSKFFESQARPFLLPCNSRELIAVQDQFETSLFQSGISLQKQHKGKVCRTQGMKM